MNLRLSLGVVNSQFSCRANAYFNVKYRHERKKHIYNSNNINSHSGRAYLSRVRPQASQ